MFKYRIFTIIFLLSLVLSFVLLPILTKADESTWDWNWNAINSKPILVSDEKVDFNANSLYVVDLLTDMPLYQKNIDHIQPVASITKLMTATVLLENYKETDIVDVTYNAASVNGSVMHLVAGEKIKIIDIVYGMIISSANDGALAVSDFYGKGKIVGLMNKKAQELGLKNTRFFDDIGLSKDNYSTARDLYFLSKYALTKPAIKDAASHTTYELVSSSGQTHMLSTTNRLLKQYSDIFGLKTGYTEEAGNCLIAYSIQNDHPIISVMLGHPDYNLRFSDSRELLDWVWESYKW